jgi:hypothetical protein
VHAQVSDPGLAKRTKVEGVPLEECQAWAKPGCFVELVFSSFSLFRHRSVSDVSASRRPSVLAVLVAVHGSKAGTPSIPGFGQSLCRSKKQST